MSRDLRTKYLYIDYIFQDRILFVEKPIIVHSSLNMSLLYDIISKKLGVSSPESYFKLFCNSKICSSIKSEQNTLHSIFGIEQYKIRVLLTREYFELISKLGVIPEVNLKTVIKPEIIVKYNRFEFTTNALNVKELQENIEQRFKIIPKHQKIVIAGKIISNDPSKTFSEMQSKHRKIKVQLLNETPVETPIKKPFADKSSKGHLEDFEISWDDYKELSSINDKYDEFVNINTNMATCFIRCKIVEDYNVIKAMKDVDMYINKVGLDMPNIKLDLLDTLRDELHNKFYMDEKPFMTYYTRAYSLELLKARLPHPRSIEDTRFIQNMVNLLEEYGVKIGHPSCIAEQEFRSLITGDPKILTKFLDYIKTNKNTELLNKISMLNSHTAILDPTDIRPNYFKNILDKEQQQFSTTKSVVMTAGGISKDIDDQVGGNVECFQKIHSLLEREGEPKHDFGDGSKRCKLAEHILRPDGNWHHGEASGEQDEIDAIYKTLPSTIHDKPIKEVIAQTSHEPKLFNHYATNNSFHLSGTSASINNRFKFFKFDSHSPVSNPAVIWDQSIQYAIPHDMPDTSGGLNYFKKLLLDNGVKHFLFDTFGVSKSSTIKNCLWDGEDESPDKEEHGGPVCDGPSITKVTPLVNLWDPASTTKASFERTLNIAREWDKQEASKDVRDTPDDKKDTTDNFETLVKSLFIGENDKLSRPGGEYRPTDGWDPNDTDLQNWWPIRGDLSKYYEVTFRPGYKTRPLQLILKNPDTPTTPIHTVIPLQQGFSVDQLTIIMASIIPKEARAVATENKKLQDKINKITSPGTVIDLTNTKAAFESWTIDPSIKIKILLDMKKSGDWSLVKWTYIVNKFFAKDHKTILLSADKLCALFGILNDIPVLFGSSSLTLIKNEDGSLSNMEAKLMGYYSGTDTPLTLEDINKDIRYIVKQLFKGTHEPPITPEIFLETWVSDISEESPLIEYLVSRLKGISELFTDEIIANIFKSAGIFAECCKSIQSYKDNLKKSLAERSPDTNTKDAIEILREMAEIINSVEKYSKAADLESHGSKISKMLNTMVTLTVVYSYTGTVNALSGSISGSLGTSETKETIINEVTEATGMSAEDIWSNIGREMGKDRGGRISGSAKIISEIKNNIYELISPDIDEGKDISVEHVCDRLFAIADINKPIFTAQRQGQDATVREEKSKRMSFFLKDMSNIMRIFFDFPIINQLFIEIPQLVASIPGTISDKINTFMSKIKGPSYKIDSYWDPADILKITQSITDRIFLTISPEMAHDIKGLSKIYNCFSSIFNNSHNNIFSIGSMVDTIQVDDDEDAKEDEKEKLTDILTQLDTMKSNMSVLSGLVQPVISTHHDEFMEQRKLADIAERVGEAKLEAVSDKDETDSDSGAHGADSIPLESISLGSAHNPSNSKVTVDSIVGMVSPARGDSIVGYGYITKINKDSIDVTTLTEYIDDAGNTIAIGSSIDYYSIYYKAVSLPVASNIVGGLSINSHGSITAIHKPVKKNDLVTILRIDKKTVAGLGIIRDKGGLPDELKVYVLTAYVNDSDENINIGEYISYEKEYFNYVTKEEIIAKQVSIQSNIEPVTKSAEE